MNKCNTETNHFGRQGMDEDSLYEVAQGERGELWCKSPTMMSGYWRKPEETRQVIMSDGWFRTGDIVIRDRDGKSVIVDRKKVNFFEVTISTCNVDSH